MKLKLLREHCQRRNKNFWKPKVPYDSEQEIIDAGFSPSLWRFYVCGFCHKWHKARNF